MSLNCLSLATVYQLGHRVFMLPAGGLDCLYVFLTCSSVFIPVDDDP